MKRALVLLLALAATALSPAAAAPSNDDFESAASVTSLNATLEADLAGATRQTGEPVDCGGIRRSVWYALTLPEAADVQFRVSGSGLKTLALYTGGALGSLTRTSCTWSSYSSPEARRTVGAGETVLIQVGAGFEGAQTTTLTLKPLYSISGLVTDEASNPLAGICVSRRGVNDTMSYSSTKTAADGTYTLDKLGAGDHRVDFRACLDGKYIEEYYDNSSSAGGATLVGVSSDVTGIDATLDRASRIVGVLTDERTSGPAKSTCVYAYQGSTFVAGGTSNAAGEYWVKVPPGTYTVQVGNCGFMPEWWEDASTQAGATPVTVPAATDVVVNASLDPGGTVKGRLTKSGGAPAVGECVQIYNTEETVVRTSSTNGLGDYEIRGLAAGTYRVRFAGCWYSAHIPEWHENAHSFLTATPLDVTLEVPVIADAVLDPGAGISGTVRDEEGFGVFNPCLTVYDTDGNAVTTVAGTPQGSYSVDRLPDGTYKVRFGCDAREYLPRWYGGTDFATATTISVTSGSTATGIDAVLSFRRPPANDNFADAAAVGSLPYSDVRDVTLATLETGEGRCGAPTRSIWYRLRLDEARLVEASTVGTVDVDTAIAVFVMGPTGPVSLRCANAWNGQTVGEQLDFVALPGVDMFIQVGIIGGSTRASAVRFSVS